MLILVVSGPKITRDEAVASLRAAGWSTSVPCLRNVETPGGMRQSSDAVDHLAHSWGLPSYRSAAEAHSAGKPNAAHTPGTPHPTTGKAYAPDKRISFATVAIEADDPSTALGHASDAIAGSGWVARSHTTKVPIVLTTAQAQGLKGVSL